MKHFLFFLSTQLLFLFTLNELNAQTTATCTLGSQPKLCVQFGDQTPDIVFTGNVSTGSLFNTSLTNKTVRIDGTFEVNSTFTFTNCTLKFGQLGKIEVANGGNLNAVGSRFFSCSFTGWNGMNIWGNGKIYLENCHIEDALDAVKISSSSAEISLIANYFNRNINDIRVVQNVAANAIIVGNTFECTENTFMNSISDNGIVAEKLSTLVVGSPQSTPTVLTNQFKAHVTGAIGYKSLLEFRNTNFECNLLAGISISLGSLTVKGSPTTKTLFRNNRYDILSENASLNIIDCEFRQCLKENITSVNNANNPLIKIGTTATFSSSRNLFVLDNNNTGGTISKTGVLLDRSTGGGGNHHIANNDFIIEQYGSSLERAAIKLNGYTGTAGLFEIKSNSVTMFQGGGSPTSNRISTPFNLKVGPAPNYFFRFNAIATFNLGSATSDLYGNRWGFYVHDWESPSSGNHFEQNVITGTDAEFDHGMCAFHFSNSGPWDICDNFTDKTLRGFHINFDCSPSIFAGNNIGDHKRKPGISSTTAGILMESGSKIGVQGIDPSGNVICRHNNFLKSDYSPDRGAWHKGSSANANESRFYYNPNISTELPFPIQSTSSSWFFDIDCGEGPFSHCGAEGNLLITALTDDEKALVQNFSSSNITRDEWEQQYDLLVRMLMYPDLVNYNEAATLFFNSRLNSSPGLFAQFAFMHHNAMLIPEPYASNLTFIRNSIDEQLVLLGALDSVLLSLDNYKTVSTSQFSQRYQILNDIHALQVQEDEIAEIITKIRKVNLDTCLIFLENLPQNSIVEQNNYALNVIALKKSHGQSIDATDILALEAIAMQCFDVAGRDKSKAIDLLPLDNSLKVLNDNPEIEICDRVEKNDLGHNLVANSIQITPNPAKTEVNIVFTYPVTGTVQILNSLGKACKSYNVHEDIQLRLDTDSFSNGVYWVQVSQAGGVIMAKKMIILR